MAPTVNNQPYTLAVIPRISLEFSMAWNFEDEIHFGGRDCHWTLLLPYFYNDVVDYLPVDQATWDRFPARTCWNIFALCQ